MTAHHRGEVDRIFERALEVPAEELDGFLATSCGNDAALRAEVETLLAASAAGDTLFDKDLSADPFWVELSADLASTDSAASGEVIGAYRVERELGRGGMAVVYLAERAEGEFEQRVALKLMRSAAGGGDMAERFRQERQILASLEHPNVARLIDGGVTPEGRSYLVMEYVDGVPIDRYCDEQRLSVEERLELFGVVARTVDAAHQRLVVHRDLKPSNILVTGEREVKLLDFGIAKLLDTEGAAQAAPVTRTAQRMLTPEYASPEQVRGEAITTASDVYQLGLLLYELLTGQRPYALTDRSPAELERAICETEPTRPSAAVDREGEVLAPSGAAATTAQAIAEARGTSPRRLARRLRGDLDTIVLTALRKEPARRYRSADRMAEDVRRHLEALPVRARPENVAYRARKFVERHVVGVTSSAVMVLLVAGLVGFYSTRLAEERNIARREAAASRQVADFLTGLLEAADPAVSRGEEMTARELLDEGAARLSWELADQPAIRAQLLTTMGAAYRQLGVFDRSEALLEDALETRREVLGEDDPGVFESQVELARTYSEQDRVDEARSLLSETLEAQERLLGPDHPDLADTVQLLGQAAWRLDQASAHEEAELLLRRAVAINERDGRRGVETASALSDLARFLVAESRYEESVEVYHEVIGIYETTLGSDHPELVDVFSNLARPLELLGRYEEAEAVLLRGLPIQERILESDHPDLTGTRIRLAQVYEQQGRFSEALELYDPILAAAESRYGPDSNRMAVVIGNKALLLDEMGRDPDEALALFRRCLEIMESHWGGDHGNVAWATMSLATALKNRGDFEGSERLYRRSLRMWEAVSGPGHRRVGQCALFLAELYRAHGRLADAEPLYRRALTIFQDLFGPDHVQTVQAIEFYAAALRAGGRDGDAERLERDGLPHDAAVSEQ